MKWIRVEGIRYVIFCIVVLLLTFQGSVSANNFFIIAVSFLVLNFLLEKVGFNEDVESKRFIFSYTAFVVITVIIVNYYFWLK